jgi:hypothetical protein
LRITRAAPVSYRETYEALAPWRFDLTVDQVPTNAAE